jgi:hypothetical protein
MWFDSLMQAWKLPWTHWLVFGVVWLLTYLSVSAILYSQYAMWFRGKYPWIIYAIAIISSLAGIWSGFLILIGINAVFNWYITGKDPPLPQYLFTLNYQPFWLLLIIPVVVLGTWFVIELHLIRKLLEKK